MVRRAVRHRENKHSRILMVVLAPPKQVAPVRVAAQVSTDITVLLAVFRPCFASQFHHNSVVVVDHHVEQVLVVVRGD